MIKQAIKKQRGFSLVEVSVASLVFAIGLIGVAAMQRLAWQESNNNYWQAIALQLSEDYSERAKSNRVESLSGDYQFSDDQSDPGYDCVATFDAIFDPLSCSSGAVVLSDQYAFANAVKIQLPEGEAAAQRIGSVYQVTVQWVDPANGEDHRLQTYFVP